MLRPSGAPTDSGERRGVSPQWFRSHGGLTPRRSPLLPERVRAPRLSPVVAYAPKPCYWFERVLIDEISRMPRTRRSFPLAAILILLAFAVSTGCNKSPVQRAGGCGTPGLWEISDGEQKCYLFGSVHLGNDELFPLPPGIEQAFADCDTFIIEANPDGISPTHAALFIAANGVYTNGDRLENHVTKETLEMLRDYCDENKIPWSTAEQLKPWAALCLVDGKEYAKIGYDIEKGVDKHFLKEAAKQKKRIVELETARSQMELFARNEPRLQAKLLQDTLQELGSYRQNVDSVFNAWKSGDLEEMNRVFLTEPALRHPEQKDFLIKVFDERNAKMASKIANHLKAYKQSAFVLVGAGHLPGDKGLLKLLESKGLSVRRITY